MLHVCVVVSEPRVMTDPAAVVRFVRAGRARVTLTSRRTQARYTYRVAGGEPGSGLLFVSLLAGPDNETSYQYLGTVFRDGAFSTTRKSKLRYDSPPARAFEYFARHVLRGAEMPPELEVRHEGRCGRCGRALTVPESIDRGVGPECYAAMGLQPELAL